MDRSNIEVVDTGWGIMARGQDDADMEHRFWFDVTDAGRLVFGAEVIEDSGTEGAPAIRHFVPDDQMEIPDAVRAELSAEGYDTIVDTEGYVL